MNLTPEEIALLRRILWSFGELVMFGVLLILFALYMKCWWFHVERLLDLSKRRNAELLEEKDKK